MCKYMASYLFLKILKESGVCGLLQSVLLCASSCEPPEDTFLAAGDLQMSYVWNKVLLAKVNGGHD